MASTASTAKRCAAQNRKGRPCGAYAVIGSDFCFWHDPAYIRQRNEAVSKGGRARHGRRLNGASSTGGADIETAGDVLPVLRGAIDDVLRLENSVARARAVGYLCGQIIKAFEVTDLQRRVEALEAILSSREG